MTVRRMKTYTGATGAVYQYYFVGQRAAPAAAGTEYVFDVTADRATTFAVCIMVEQAALAAWAAAHGRALTETERYAAAKMRLFAAFDEEEQLIAARAHAVTAANIEQVLEPLGLV